MGWRMRKSIKLGGGLRLNLSRSGIGASVGMKGFRIGVGPRGGRITAGIPGTGVTYETRFGSRQTRRPSRSVKAGTRRLVYEQKVHPKDISAFPQKSLGVAYLLWFPLGIIGAHRYYLGKTGTAIAQTLTLGGLGVWWLVDFFLIPSMTHQANNRASRG